LYAVCGQENTEVLVWDLENCSLLVHLKASFIFFVYLLLVQESGIAFSSDISLFSRPNKLD